MAEIANYTSTFSSGDTITIKTTQYHNNGASSTQELAFAIATGTEYVRELLKRNIPLENIFPKMRFIMAIGDNFFMEIAKFRAARILWAKISSEFGYKYPLNLHAESSRWNKTILDPYVNLLRTTTEGFAAVVGGASTITIAPFDEIIKTPDEFSMRLARNIHIILRDECNMKNVIDPSGGSWYVEWLTDKVASESWGIFQMIEENGGFSSSLMKGIPQEMVAKMADRKKRDFSKRKSVLVGTNMFPNPSESITITESFSDENSAVLKNYPTKVEPLKKSRLSEEYERLRMASTVYERKNGHKPSIFQINIGPSRLYRARADWTTSFFQSGGFEVISDNDFDSIDEAIEYFNENNSEIAILVSTDEKYLEIVETYSTSFKRRFPDSYLILAGTPGEHEEKWRKCGIDDFVNIKVNNYEMNKKLLARVGAI
jgi:methylmalonyl-CoA mutase